MTSQNSLYITLQYLRTVDGRNKYVCVTFGYIQRIGNLRLSNTKDSISTGLYIIQEAPRRRAIYFMPQIQGGLLWISTKRFGESQIRSSRELWLCV